MLNIFILVLNATEKRNQMIFIEIVKASPIWVFYVSIVFGIILIRYSLYSFVASLMYSLLNDDQADPRELAFAKTQVFSHFAGIFSLLLNHKVENAYLQNGFFLLGIIFLLIGSIYFANKNRFRAEQTVIRNFLLSIVSWLSIVFSLAYWISMN